MSKINFGACKNLEIVDDLEQRWDDLRQYEGDIYHVQFFFKIPLIIQMKK
jgi:hypothetical protein